MIALGNSIRKIGIMLLFLSFVTVAMAQEELRVIGSLGSVPTELDMSKLTAVLRGEQMRWKDGTKVKIALMKTNTPIGKITCTKVFGMSPNELNKYFLALVFQGKIKAPSFFNSESDLEEYVAQNPGAIGVLNNSSSKDVKIVIIDGKEQF